MQTISTSEKKYGELWSERNSYRAAKSRCTNPNTADYKYYGGRGIQFRFKNFQEFLAELGRKPSKKDTVDRIDVNGHYEAGNVQWANRREQMNNTRMNHNITAFGETLSIAEWSRRTGIKQRNIHFRKKVGWCLDCILSPTVETCVHGYDRKDAYKISARNRSNNKRITALGQTRLLCEWSELLGVKITTITQRLYAYGFCNDCAVSLKAGQKCLHKNKIQ